MALAGAALVAAVAALAQQDSSPVSFSGTVMNANTGAAVPYARVVLLPEGSETTCDAGGVFQFPQVLPGEHMVTASKTGFTLVAGHEEGYEVPLSASLDKFRIWLAPLSAIRGRITDGDGEPVEGATVVALASTIESGRRRNRTVSNPAVTDDRGEYRIGLLTPGRYLVRASPKSSQRHYYGDDAPPPEARENFGPAYWGGSREAAGAAAVQLQPGATARADFSVTLQPGHRIRGRIANLRPHTTADLQLSSGDDDLGTISNSLELVTGRFEIDGVSDGAYRLRAYQPGGGGHLTFAERDVVVDGHDVEGVTLTLAEAPSVKGTLRVDGPWDKPGPFFLATLETQDAFLAMREGQGQLSSGEAKDGAFEIPSVVPGRYWISLGAGNGLYVSAARAGDTDLLATQELVAGAGTGIEVVLRTDGGGISGTIHAEAAGDSDLAVLLVPETCDRPVRVTIARAELGFSFQGVAPGSYRLHAWKERAEVEYGSREALCALARGGTPVEVKAGEVAKVELQGLSEEPK
jgi:hypothetical protein